MNKKSLGNSLNKNSTYWRLQIMKNLIILLFLVGCNIQKDTTIVQLPDRPTDIETSAGLKIHNESVDVSNASLDCLVRVASQMIPELNVSGWQIIVVPVGQVIDCTRGARGVYDCLDTTGKIYQMTWFKNWPFEVSTMFLMHAMGQITYVGEWTDTRYALVESTITDGVEECSELQD